MKQYLYSYSFRNPPHLPNLTTALRREFAIDPWAELQTTPLGRIVLALINNPERKTASDCAANDNTRSAKQLIEQVSCLDLLMTVREMLCAGHEIHRDIRKEIYRIAWANRGWLPPDLVLYAALGGGICGDD